ncbi:unnamed protein product [Lymnaea stagnalis]|uniref:CAP-Gly domain-containing protein n=1 Tax=Lymnaea stagnalis TaxID=6523 RepID=A0AAV2I6F1_LYMST
MALNGENELRSRKIDDNHRRRHRHHFHNDCHCSCHNHSQNNNNKNHEDEKQIICVCGHCKSLKNHQTYHDGKSKNSNLSSDNESSTSSTSNARQVIKYKKGVRVLVNVNGSVYHSKQAKQFPGVVQYVGLSDELLKAPRSKVGISLYDNVYSTHNGVYKGKRYFFCPRGHGAMVNLTDIKLMQPIAPTQPLTGNPMFPSYKEVKKIRKLRQQKIEEAEEKLRIEHQMKRREQMERFSKSAPQPKISIHSNKASKLRTEKPGQSEDDIELQYYQDVERLNHMKLVEQETSERQLLRKMKKVFGGDDKAERMAQTLLKLHHAFEEGRSLDKTD